MGQLSNTIQMDQGRIYEQSTVHEIKLAIVSMEIDLPWLGISAPSRVLTAPVLLSGACTCGC